MDDGDRVLSTFEKLDQFSKLQQSLLKFNILEDPTAEQHSEEWDIFKHLGAILDEYQEQPYLLDPSLEALITPVVEALKTHAKEVAKNSGQNVSGKRVPLVAALLHRYIKLRGYKAITRFFPHEIADVPIVLDYLVSPVFPSWTSNFQWSVRYVVLLWLSMICMIPFDLDQFDERDQTGRTAEKLENLGLTFIDKAGLDRDGAAILLARLYMRKDTSARLPDFLQQSLQVVDKDTGPFHTLGVLQVLGEVAKAGSAQQVQTNSDLFFQIAKTVQDKKSQMSNTLIRKHHVKLISRVVLRLLPATVIRSRAKGRALSAMIGDAGATEADTEEDIFDVPEEVETVLEYLFSALQDRDTVVRWAAAKGIARITERLPAEFALQVVQTVINLFAIHSAGVASIYDMPTVAEGTWHGACLACAELARRGIVPDEQLPELMQWLCKALYFDIRKGAHSIGSNVRDAASYVLWSLARAQSATALAPHAENLSRTLVVVSLFDREVSIRRAASATYQEFVGRTSLFAHGIDVLSKTDFFAVGMRRNAFLVAATEVAEHAEYRSSIIDHLLNITLRHWDPTMRELGAQSLACVCKLDLVNLGPTCVERAIKLVGVPDVADIHGALLALKEIADAYSSSTVVHDWDAERRKIFASLTQAPSHIVQSTRNELVTATACYLIASSISKPETQLDQSSVPHWRQIVDFGLKSKSSVVQEAAATAMAAVDITFVLDFHSVPVYMHQSISRTLGVLDYNTSADALQPAIQCLLTCVDRSIPANTLDIETRRNAFCAMPQLVATVAPTLQQRLNAATMNQILGAYLDGLTDYTTDDRGDVGSWVRIACVQGLATLTEILFNVAPHNLVEYLPPETYHSYIGGILKQGVERLDNVRQAAGECFTRLLLLPLPAVPDAEAWRMHGDALMKGVLLGDTEVVGWSNSQWLFPKALAFLNIESYRESVLQGLVLSASSKTDSTQRPVSASFVTFAQGLSVSSTEKDTYDLRGLAKDLIELAQRNLSSNNVVVPVLQSFHVLLEADAFDRLAEDGPGLEALRTLLSVCTKNVARLKNPQRILMSMRVAVDLLSVPTLRRIAVENLISFLAHQFPRVRADTAEHLYLVLQTKDLGLETDDAESILLETEWSSTDFDAVKNAAEQCVHLLSASDE